MKVQVVQLDAHDDQISAREKLAGAVAPRVLLVWPEQGRILGRQLDLVLLKRAAQRRRAQLGLVTRDPDVIDHAAVLDIPVFDTPDHIPESGWRKNRRAQLRPPKPPDQEAKTAAAARPRARAQLPAAVRRSIAAVAILSLAAAAAAILPSAEVILSPSFEVQQAELTIDLQFPDSNPSALSIPAQRLVTRMAGELRSSTSGQVEVPTRFAEGKVVFTNLSDDPQIIPVGQTVRPAGREDLFFSTIEAASLPAGKGAVVVAGIRASVAGAVGNVAAETLDAVDGPLGLLVSVANPTPTSGGGSDVHSAATPLDRSVLKAALQRELVARAEQQWLGSLPNEFRLAPGSSSITRIFTEVYSPGLGLPADSHSLTLDVEVSAVSFRWQDLEQAVRDHLGPLLAQGMEPIPGSLRVTLLPGGAEPPGSTSLHVQEVQNIFVPVDREALAQRIAGRPVVEAQRIVLEGGSYSSSPSFRVAPSWFPTLPFLPIRIQIRWSWEPG